MQKSELKADETKFEQFLDAIATRNWRRVSVWTLAAWFAFGVFLLSSGEKLGLARFATQAGLLWAALFIALIAWTFWTHLRKSSKSNGRIVNVGGAVRGLIPFEENDVSLFRRMGRQHDIDRLIKALTSSHFKIGYISGESGVGKSSLLQAGVVPALKEAGYVVHIIEVSNADVQEAILRELGASESGEMFLQRLRSAVPTETKPIIVILDQFEQWFVHRKRDEEREPLLSALAEWYEAQPAVNLRLLISIREDFVGRLAEIQGRLGYDLTLQNNQRVEKFRVHEAVELLGVMAETEAIGFDRSFVHKQLTEQLADRGDGRVSPVDLQILAAVVTRDRTERDTGFTSGDFQRFGGVEGLLETYLRQQLDALAVGHEGSDRRRAAIAVMRTLSDFEGSTGVGVLREDQILERLAGIQPEAHIQKAVQWLSRPDVRLLVPREGGYRLVHDRVVDALRKLVSDSLTESEKATRLISQRVAEYLSNSRRSRFLLTFAEWRFLNRHKSLIEWGKQESEKRELLKRSGRKYRTRLAVLAGVLVLFVGSWAWFQTLPGLRWAAEKYLVLLESQNVLDGTLLAENAWLAAASGQHARAAALFDKAVATTAESPDPYRQLSTYASIAILANRAGDKTRSAAILSRAEAVITKIPDVLQRPTSYCEIARFAIRSGDQSRGATMLQKARTLADTISDAQFRAVAYSCIAVGQKEAGDRESAALLLKQSIRIAEQNAFPLIEHNLFSTIAQAAAAISETGTSELFDRAAAAAGRQPESFSRSISYLTIVRKLAFSAWECKSTALFDKAKEVAHRIEDPGERSQAHWTIAASMLSMWQDTGDTRWLKGIAEVAGELPSSDGLAAAYRAIVDGIEANAAASGALLQKAHEATEKIADPSYRGTAYRHLADSHAKAGRLKASLDCASDIPFVDLRAQSIARVLAISHGVDVRRMYN